MPSLDDLRRRYAALSDQDLFGLWEEAEDLMPEAREVLEEELKKRTQAAPGSSAETADLQVWENEVGHYLTIGRMADEELIDPSEEGGMRRRCRDVAESEGGGLVEATAVPSKHGPAVSFIYKTLDMPAFTFTGVLLLPTPKGGIRWTFRAPEGPMTGEREAAVTAQLMSGGELTLESYESSWAQDPYDPEYRGVDSRTLRYMSDDPKYDEMFPAHPLTAVRAVLRELLEHGYDGGWMP